MEVEDSDQDEELPGTQDSAESILIQCQESQDRLANCSCECNEE